MWHVGIQCPFDPKCCQPKMQICFRTNHNWVVLMTFVFFSTPRFPCSPIFISQPLQWIWECPSFVGEKPYVESEICCQSVGSDLFLRIFNSQQLWEPKANALRGGCCTYMYPVANRWWSHRWTRCAVVECVIISLVGLILMDFKVAWWAFKQIHLTCRDTILCVSAAIRLRPHETLVNSDADR